MWDEEVFRLGQIFQSGMVLQVIQRHKHFDTGWTREHCVGLSCSFFGTLLQFCLSVQRWGTCCYNGRWSLCWWLLDYPIALSRSRHWLFADNSERRAESRNTGHRLTTNIPLCTKDLSFGEVWVCSGQSNMEFNMFGIFDAENEMDLSAAYTEV